jgi:hypothetical protein
MTLLKIIEQVVGALLIALVLLDVFLTVQVRRLQAVLPVQLTGGNVGDIAHPDLPDADLDLTRPRNVEFTVVFTNENGATHFADHIRSLGYSASTELT